MPAAQCLQCANWPMYSDYCGMGPLLNTTVMCLLSFSGLQNYVPYDVSVTTFYTNDSQSAASMLALPITAYPWMSIGLLRKLYNIPTGTVGSETKNSQAVVEFLGQVCTSSTHECVYVCSCSLLVLRILRSSSIPFGTRSLGKCQRHRGGISSACKVHSHLSPPSVLGSLTLYYSAEPGAEANLDIQYMMGLVRVSSLFFFCVCVCVSYVYIYLSFAFLLPLLVPRLLISAPLSSSISTLPMAARRISWTG